ncbi:helix-turn-helix domain-containing protein [Acinetobacter qingfengensis]|nr:helix-turn-helix domain-containing protein [Acinetobacter qingfengensis]
MLENDATVTTQAAPILNLDYEWNHALLGRAMQHCYKDLIAIANDSGMAIGISNHHGTLLWTNCSRSMLSSAEQVHFIEGGLWSTQAVGNNALGLALDTMHSSCVYSHENEMNSVRDWVCYAAPILDYTTTHFHGIINLSTKSHKHTSLGILAIERCAEMVQRAIQFEQNDVLYIQAFGSPQIQFNQKKLTLTHRQLEILCILILHPNGVHLDELHYALYGDRQVSISTLKAELSQLRQLLNNKIHSRPYRLDCEIQCDFLMAEQAIDLHFDASVLALYKGSFLPKTESPLLAAWRDCFDARLSQLIFRLRDTDQLLKIISRIPERTDAVERLLELLPENHQIRQKFQQLVE